MYVVRLEWCDNVWLQDAACEDTPSSDSSEEEDTLEESERKEEDWQKRMAELEKERVDLLI